MQLLQNIWVVLHLDGPQCSAEDLWLLPGKEVDMHCEEYSGVQEQHQEDSGKEGLRPLKKVQFTME